MPAFVLISGYFAKKILCRKQLFIIVGRVIVPYVAFEILYSFFEYLVFGKSEFSLTLFTPYWILWYLMSLMCWYLLLPIFTNLKYPVVISVILSLFVGYATDVGYYFSLSRTIVFFPFFLLGYSLSKEHFIKLKMFIPKKISLLFFIIVFSIFYIFGSDFNHHWFYGSTSYHNLGFDQFYAFTIRLMVYFISTLMLFSFMVLIPIRKTIVSEMGTRTFTIYLLHGFIVKYLVYLDIYSYINSSLDKIGLIVGGILITIILGSRAIRSFTSTLVQPNVEWLYRLKI